MDALQYFNQGIEKSRKKDLEGAIQDYTKAIELSSSTTKRTITEKDNDGSLLHTNIIETNEGNVNVYYNRGCAYFDTHNYKEALYDYSKVIEYSPQDAETYFRRATVNYCLGYDEASKEDLSKAFNLNPKYTEELFLNQFIK